MRYQCGAGARNDQFTDKIDQMIQLFRIDAHRLRLAGFSFSHARLLLDGGIQHRTVYHAFVHHDIADGFTRPVPALCLLNTQCRLQFDLRQ